MLHSLSGVASMGAGVTQQGPHLRRSVGSAEPRSADNDLLHVAIMTARVKTSGRRPSALGCRAEVNCSGAAQELRDDLAGLLTALVGDAL